MLTMLLSGFGSNFSLTSFSIDEASDERLVCPGIFKSELFEFRLRWWLLEVPYPVVELELVARSEEEI